MATPRTSWDDGRAGQDLLAAAELSSLVGRESLLEEAKSLVAAPQTRTLTLIGMGGVGKTRVALHVAGRVADRYAAGVHLVSLAGVPSGDHVPQVIADALGLMDNTATPTSAASAAMVRLISHIGDTVTDEKRMLLVLDNCEHLTGPTLGSVSPATPSISRIAAQLLMASRGVRIIATSRVRLGVPGEVLLGIPPLCTGATSDCDCAPGAPHAAAQLLLERASALRTTVTKHDVPDIERLARLLDGIPLALELAAVRLVSRTPSDIIDRRRELLDLLVDRNADRVQSHQATLETTLDVSYDLLGAREQLVWRILSVFSDKFGRDAAVAVCAAGGLDASDVDDALSELVQASILDAQRVGGGVRYRMLEVLRQYGETKLAAGSLDAAHVHAAYATHYVQVCEHATQEWFGPREIECLRALRAELPHLRAVQRALVDAGDPRGMTLAFALFRTRALMFTGQLDELRRMLHLGVPPSVDTAAPAREVIMVLAAESSVAMLQGSPELGERMLRAAEEVAARAGLTPPVLEAARATHLWLTASDPDVARDALALYTRAEAALTGADGVTDGDVFVLRLYRAWAAALVGDRETAYADADAVLASARAAQAPWAASWALWTRALAEVRHGAPRQALVLLREAVAVQEATCDMWGVAWATWLLAVIMGRLGRHELAAQLWASTQLAQDQAQARILALAPFRRVQEAAEATTRRALGDQWDVQYALGLAQPQTARATALAETPADPEEPGQQPNLTEREWEVAELIASGLTSKDIAERLHIASRTVDAHVASILSKLGLRRRNQIGTVLRAPAAAS